MNAADNGATEGASDGGTVTFEQFFADSRPRLVRSLSLYFNSDDLGADAADEAMARACERWDEVAAHPNPYGWVYVVGTNCGRSALRRRATARAKQAAVAHSVVAPGEETDLDTRAAVAALKPAYRSVVIGRFYMGWSVAETAAALGISEGTVKSRLSRALRQLREHLTVNTEAAAASEAEHPARPKSDLHEATT